MRPVPLIAALVLLSAAGCGTQTNECQDLAEMACSRWQDCGFIDERSRDRCIDEEKERCETALCSEGLVPIEGEAERCAHLLDGRRCDELAFGEACPEVVCIVADGDDGQTTEYFSGYGPMDLLPCEDGEVPQLHGTVEVRLFHDATTNARDLADCTRGLQRYYEPYDLWFYTGSGSEEIRLRAVLDAPEGELTYALNDAGIPTDRELTEEELDQAADVFSELLFRPLREFLDEHGRNGVGAVNFTLVPLIAGNSVAYWLFPDSVILGLGVSPALNERATSADELARVYELMGVEGEFTPSVFLSRDTIHQYNARCDFVSAHEMGHALGLPHEVVPTNLMYGEASERCVPVLTQVQADGLNSIRVLAELVPAGRFVDPLDLAREVRAATPRLVEHLREWQAGQAGGR